MAEGEEGGDARPPPVRLWVRRIGVYCDENQKTWLVAPEEARGWHTESPDQKSPGPPGVRRYAPAACLHPSCPTCGSFRRGSSTGTATPESGILNTICYSLDMPQKDPCQKQACEIQKCLQANNYMESKCEAVLQEMRKCCSRYPPGRSICCSGFVLEEKERQKQKPASKGTQDPHA